MLSEKELAMSTISSIEASFSRSMITLILSENFSCANTLAISFVRSFFGIIRVISSSNFSFKAKNPVATKKNSAINQAI
ncbi:hypothetical protein D3C80_999560 [compost metagenome]